ncbi:MAG: MASE1 domain-containing protein [Hyphomonadaceae bacterium]|nr:MASE1 domain-containing protein [Hyphomonadaceae bacterium]
MGAVGVAYGVLSFASLYFTRFGAEVEALWVSNALLTAALVASAGRHWPWLLVAAACGHFSAHRIAGDPLGLSLAFLLSDLGESVLCASLLRARPSALAMQNFAGVAEFLAICVFSAAASCAATTFGNWALGAPLSGADVLIWLLADALGLFIFLPLFFGLDEAQWRQARARPAQLLLALALVFALAVIGAYTQSPIPRLLSLPLSVVIAFRFGVAGVELALSAILVTWVVSTYLGHPPGAWPDLDMRGYLLLAQAFVAALAMTVVPLAVILEDRERLSMRLAEAAKADATKREAEKANAFKSRLIAMASHDLRQPVLAAQSYLDAIETRLRDPETQALCVKATQALDSMTNILEALLDVSRLDAGIIAPRPRDFPVSEVFERVAAVNRPCAEAKGLLLRVETSPHIVHSDPSLVERIVDNFVSNAIRYTERGEVTVWTEVRGDMLAVNVTDTGIGIAPEALPSIFDDYVQLNNPERDRSKGLGLGLTIARRMASLLDLRIDVRTTGGEGSTFTIELPLASAQAP